MSTLTSRPVWGSKLGFLLAAIGSAIGLGNIWRFSYMSFKYGGGAFLVPYAVALLCAGIPLMILEYTLGHREKGSTPLAFARVSRKWEWVGWWMPTVAMFGINLYYAVVIGWCINYLVFAVSLAWGADAQAYFFNEFLQVSDSPFALGGVRMWILGSTALVWGVVWAICYREVNHGIEKACMIFMPILAVLTLILVGWTLSLDGAWDAVRNRYLTPDWAKINIFDWQNREVWDIWVAAFGQIFFTLSLGFGIMVTYASYLPEKTDIVGHAIWTSLVNCLYSFVAGFAVFGIVGFMAVTQDLPFDEVIKSGPQLAFVVYPAAISQLPFGQNFFGILFFVMLVMAGLSSAISLVEAFACSVSDKFAWSRRKVVSTVCLLGFTGSVVFTTHGGLLVLDIVDHYVTNYALIIGGILECILVGWVLKAHVAREHVNQCGGLPLSPVWDVCVRYVTPIILILVVGKAFVSEISAAYGGYPKEALLLYGGGWLAVTALAALMFALYRWTPDRLRREHHPQEDHLLT